VHPDDLVDDPHFRAREYFVEVYHPETGALRYPGAPFKMSETPWAIRRPAPRLGEHNREGYGGRLGLRRQDLEEYRAEGLIGARSAECGVGRGNGERATSAAYQGVRPARD